MNRGMRVLQTLALPLGYVTVCQRKPLYYTSMPVVKSEMPNRNSSAVSDECLRRGQKRKILCAGIARTDGLWQIRRAFIACSAGNHAQGMAWKADCRPRYGHQGHDLHPGMGAHPPRLKMEATRNYGAEVVLVPGVYDDAYAEAVRLRDEQGLTFIHPFNDYSVMAGQGTIGLEILGAAAGRGHDLRPHRRRWAHRRPRSTP